MAVKNCKIGVITQGTQNSQRINKNTMESVI